MAFLWEGWAPPHLYNHLFRDDGLPTGTVMPCGGPVIPPPPPLLWQAPRQGALLGRVTALFQPCPPSSAEEGFSGGPDETGHSWPALLHTGPSDAQPFKLSTTTAASVPRGRFMRMYHQILLLCFHSGRSTGSVTVWEARIRCRRPQCNLIGPGTHLSKTFCALMAQVSSHGEACSHPHLSP